VRKRLPWWRRPIRLEKWPSLLRSRASLTVLVVIIIELSSTPWLLAPTGALIILSCLFALIIRSRNRSDLCTILKLR
jgi:hypothetical protein